MMHSRIFLLVIIMFSSFTHSMEQKNIITDDMEKLIKKYVASSLIEDFHYFLTSNASIYGADPDLVLKKIDHEWNQKEALMKKNAINEDIIKYAERKYWEHKEKIVKYTICCTYQLWIIIGTLAGGWLLLNDY